MSPPGGPGCKRRSEDEAASVAVATPCRERALFAGHKVRIVCVNNVEREIYLAPPQDPATAQTTKVGVGAQPRTEPSQALHHEGGRNVATGPQANPYGGHPSSTEGGPMAAGRERSPHGGGGKAPAASSSSSSLGRRVAAPSISWGGRRPWWSHHPSGWSTATLRVVRSTTLPVRHTRGGTLHRKGGKGGKPAAPIRGRFAKARSPSEQCENRTHTTRPVITALIPATHVSGATHTRVLIQLSPLATSLPHQLVRCPPERLASRGPWKQK